MSYCRFSTDDFQCDLYCYGSSAGYETHVAGIRYKFKEPLPDPVPLDKDHIREFTERHNKIVSMCEDAERMPIELPYAGESFTDTTLEDFYDRVKSLKEVGYRVPEYVLEEIKEEMEA